MSKDKFLAPSLHSFIFDCKVGAGAYGDVYKARCYLTGEVFAVKCVLRKFLLPAAKDNLITEISILKLLKHPNIIRMVDFRWDHYYIYIITEFCEGGDLSNLLTQKGTFSEYLIQKIIVQISQAFCYLYQMKISHFDLKPSNILLKYKCVNTDLFIKIADFGLAKFFQDAENLNTLRGSLLYMAPEVFLHHNYSPNADLWSIGVILYESLYGNPPYMSKSYKELFEKMHSPKKIMFQHKNFSPACIDLLNKLLQKDPNKRISFLDFFKHPFITEAINPVSNQSTHNKQSILNANNLIEDAYKKETIGDFSNAFNLYLNAAETLLPLIKNEIDLDKHKRMENLFNEILDRAEKVKFKAPNATQNLLFNTSNYANVGSLLDDPEINATIKLSEAAKAYQTLGDPKSLDIALKKYELCLKALLKKMDQYKTVQLCSEQDDQNFNDLSDNQKYILDMLNNFIAEIECIKKLILISKIRNDHCNKPYFASLSDPTNAHIVPHIPLNNDIANLNSTDKSLLESSPKKCNIQ